MLKKCFVAIAILMASPAFASAQDIFWSFSPTELITDSLFEPSFSMYGSAYIFSDQLFGFDGLDLEFTNSNSDGIRFTGGEAFNPEFNILPGSAFNFSEITIDASGTSGRLFSVNITQNGVNPALSALFNPSFEPNFGPSGAVLLARVDFELVGAGGDAELEFALGPQGAFGISNGVLDPSFGSATIVTAVPICVGPDPNNIGDLDYSGSVDFLDIAPFLGVLASAHYVFRADCNFDGDVDFLDIAPFVGLL